MGSILTNGVFLPAEGERNCYEGLAANWVALDGLIGGYGAHAANLTIHVTAADKEAWNGKADASALTAHTGNTTIHVTAAEKETWNGKADASALTAHTGDATIHVTSADKQAWNGHIADSVKHVTAEDKAKWDAVTSKADDSDVVHKSGDETINGNKTFSSINGVKPSSLSLPAYSASRIDISSYITNLTGGGNNYTAPSNGYIFVRTTNGTYLKLTEYPSGVVSSVCSQTADDIGTFIPVLAGRICIIQIKCSSIDRAYFIPCLGNV